MTSCCVGVSSFYCPFYWGVEDYLRYKVSDPSNGGNGDGRKRPTVSFFVIYHVLSPRFHLLLLNLENGLGLRFREPLVLNVYTRGTLFVK